MVKTQPQRNVDHSRNTAAICMSMRIIFVFCYHRNKHLVFPPHRNANAYGIGEQSQLPGSCVVSFASTTQHSPAPLTNKAALRRCLNLFCNNDHMDAVVLAASWSNCNLGSPPSCCGRPLLSARYRWCPPCEMMLCGCQPSPQEWVRAALHRVIVWRWASQSL